MSRSPFMGGIARPSCGVWLVFSLLLAAAASIARADSLTNAQLYFDPDTISPGMYPRIALSAVGSTQWSGSGGRTIVGANILPVLKPGSYPPGYAFTQNDYDIEPNQDYFADLTDGTLTGTFQREGLYQVRLHYSDLSSEINTVMVAAGVGGGGEAQNNAVGAIRRVDQPRGNKRADLYITSYEGLNPDPFIDGAWTNLHAAGENVANASTIAGVVDRIRERSNHLGRRINVVLVGHGRPGGIRFGPGLFGEWIMNGADGNGNVTPAQFNTMVGGFAKSLTLFSCAVGQGGEGQTFLEDLGGNNIRAGAWDDAVYAWRGGGWGVERGATFSKIPEPTAALLLVLGALAAARRSSLMGPRK